MLDHDHNNTYNDSDATLLRQRSLRRAGHIQLIATVSDAFRRIRVFRHARSSLTVDTYINKQQDQLPYLIRFQPARRPIPVVK